MDKDLGHRATAHVHVLDLLRCDVLPLSQLKDVLFPVNDLQNAALSTINHKTSGPFFSKETLTTSPKDK